jgi:hypothetical protein
MLQWKAKMIGLRLAILTSRRQDPRAQLVVMLSQDN